ncbi:uncharacterized protein ACJ7VT_006675 [Polymixia lowei]
MEAECYHVWVGLALTLLALLVSVCLNFIFCFLRRRDAVHRDTDMRLYPEAYRRQSSSRSEEERQYHFQDNDHHVQKENPIYGNISTERTEECYEMMTKQRTKDDRKPLEPDVNYASLDLNVSTKRKKKRRYRQGQTQDQSQLQARLSQSAAPMTVFLEVEAEVEALLPSRNSSPMVSHSSIYLNSQQIALETEERERELGINVKMEQTDWDDIGEWDRRRTGEWVEDREGVEDMDEVNGVDVNIATEIVEVPAINDSTDHFIGSFSHDDCPQD